MSLEYPNYQKHLRHLTSAISSGEYNGNESSGVPYGFKYDAGPSRIKSLYPGKIVNADEYVPWFNVLDDAKTMNRATRITDRVLVAQSALPALQSQFNIEAKTQLGARWEGYSFVMTGLNDEGRRLSSDTRTRLDELGQSAHTGNIKALEDLPEGYSVDIPVNFSDVDFIQLSMIYTNAFSYYLDTINNMGNPDYLRQWAAQPSLIPFVVRNPTGTIETITVADVGILRLPTGEEFVHVEIGDSASASSSPKGANRRARQVAMAYCTQFADLIFFESRATHSAVNYANGNNGCHNAGLLELNSLIGGHHNINEGADPALADWARSYQSMRVWTVSPADKKTWQYYQNLWQELKT